MLINGNPGLACQIFCDDLLKMSNEIIICPLSKFEVICDLKIDRSIIFEMMKKMQLWLKHPVSHGINTAEYSLGKCLLCGCCLEICPSFGEKRNFPGMPAAITIANLSNNENFEEYKEVYISKILSNCLRDMKCEQVCPANIPIKKSFIKLYKMCKEKRV